MDNQNSQNPTPGPIPTTDPRQQIAERLKQANNVLVTVSTNPSVDQLAACIGLTLILNKMDKHATAVFSGEVPSTIEFLQPEETLEKTTDSLRDFIIALDKAKADKLRYKVEDKVVKIFITPYRTSIGEKDLEFSQGDFNVDIVVALGVHEQKDLDQAITAHGRILHDATVTTISTTTPSTLGSINWQDSAASSLSELVTILADSLGLNLLDGQIATALLTGIVAETERFSNERTSPRTMSASATLMSAGANQQLVATKLERQQPPVESSPSPPAPIPLSIPSPSTPEPPPKPAEPPNDTLEVSHDEAPASAEQEDEDQTADWLLKQQQIHIDDEGMLHKLTDEPTGGNSPAINGSATAPTSLTEPTNSRMVIEPPTLGGTLTANSQPEGDNPPLASLSLPPVEAPMINRSGSASSAPSSMPKSDTTLDQIERIVDSPHAHAVDSASHPTLDLPAANSGQGLPNLNNIRDAVDEATSTNQPAPKPIGFGSNLFADNLNPDNSPSAAQPTALNSVFQPQTFEPTLTPPAEAAPGSLLTDQPPTMPLPPDFPKSQVPPLGPNPELSTNAPNDLPAAPPVPPPFPYDSPPANS